MNRIPFLIAAAWIFGNPAFAESPWLPAAGKASVFFTYVDDHFQDYRQGKKFNTLPEPYTQNSEFINVEYGLRDNIALDFTSGHTEAAFRGNGLNGAADSTVGIRWQALRREYWVLTFRAAGIIAGTYPITTVGNWSPGEKASGGLGSVAAGFALPKGFFSFAEAGWRVRTDPVPQEFIGNAGFGKSWKGFTFTTDYQTSRAINGVDIVGGAPKFAPPYFTAALFPATKKVIDALDWSVFYGFRNGLSFGYSYSAILHGRNAGMKRVSAVTVGYSLPVRGPHFR